MKKTFAILLTLSILLSFAACQKNREVDAEAELDEVNTSVENVGEEAEMENNENHNLGSTKYESELTTTKSTTAKLSTTKAPTTTTKATTTKATTTKPATTKPATTKPTTTKATTTKPATTKPATTKPTTTKATTTKPTTTKPTTTKTTTTKPTTTQNNVSSTVGEVFLGFLNSGVTNQTKAIQCVTNYIRTSDQSYISYFYEYINIAYESINQAYEMSLEYNGLSATSSDLKASRDILYKIKTGSYSPIELVDMIEDSIGYIESVLNTYKSIVIMY